jgi:chemotaxis signal transduction protein
MNTTTTPPRGDERQFATFRVGNLLFGVDVHEVQEIIRSQQLTPVPLAPEVVRGLMNLRGQIITAIDLRRRLGVSTTVAESDVMNIVVALDAEKRASWSTQSAMLSKCPAILLRRRHPRLVEKFASLLKEFLNCLTVSC